MNCTDFQKALPEVMESGGGAAENEHLSSCAVCSDLVQDLKYIVEAARMLVPMEDPAPRVWEGIERSLRREGLVRADHGVVRMEPFVIAGNQRGSFYGWAGIAALALVAVSMLVFGRIHTSTVAQPDITTLRPAPAPIDDDDKQLLSAIAQKSPTMGAMYTQKLRNVRSYISDAESSWNTNHDEIARQHLMNAYTQRAVLYEMAVSYTTR